VDKHRSAHAELQQAMKDLIDAIELLEGLVVKDDITRTSLTRKLTQARMHLNDARQDMRFSRIGDLGTASTRRPPTAQSGM
jgi:hypothetical protein